MGSSTMTILVFGVHHNFNAKQKFNILCYSYCSIDMLVILHSLGDPTWAERYRSSGQGSPKLCSITECIPIRLDNKCFNIMSFPVKKNRLVTLAGLLANCKHGRFSGRNFRGWHNVVIVFKHHRKWDSVDGC